MFTIAEYKPKLDALAKRDIWIGTSSWNYEGWVGQVYCGDYSGARKDFVASKFRERTLEDLAKVFPTTCFDGAYWRFPTLEQLQKFRAQLTPHFRMAMKATDLLTVRRVRDTQEKNPSYLDSTLFVEHLAKPAMEGLGDNLGPIIFEFSPFFFGRSFGGNDGYRPIDFVKDLHHFLDGIPQSIKDALKLAVEVRDPEFLDHAFGRYFDCLEYHGVAHVLNEQTWMPSVAEQLELPGIFTTDFSVVRALLRQGTSHTAAIEEFAPYNTTQMVLPEMRRGIAALMSRSASERRGLYVYVNNRTEGNAPNTIAAVLDLFEQDFVMPDDL